LQNTYWSRANISDAKRSLHPYIEDEDINLLLDVGYSDLFLRNSTALGVDLENISAIVISHGHNDHTRGLKYYFEQSHKNNISIIALKKSAI